MWLGTNILLPLRSLGGNFGFTRNEQKGCLEAFGGNANGAKHTHNVRSHVDTPSNVSEENMTRSGEVQKCCKNSQN